MNLSDEELPGHVIADRYRIVSRIASGGSGSIFRAVQLHLDRPVALKLLHAHMTTPLGSRERFLREARIASQINHPNAVVVHDFGEWEGRGFIVMELLEGMTVAQMAAVEFPFAPKRIVEILSPVADVLDLMHQHGLVHRDVKPENIMVLLDEARFGLVKLVDFGLVLLQEGLNEDDRRLTPYGLILGTPRNMSPEQAAGRTLDGRSDVYSLGTVLYWMLCGQDVFEGASSMDVLTQQLYAQPRPPSVQRADLAIHPGLEALAMMALAKRKEDRPQTAVRFRELLQEALEAEGPARTTRGLADLARTSDRSVRAGLAGIGPVGDTAVTEVSPTLARAVSGLTVLVVEDARDFSTSVTALVQAQGHSAEAVPDLGEAIGRAAAVEGALLVVDLRPDVAGRFAGLEEAARSGRLSPRSAVVVGPDEPLEHLSRALVLGVEGYVPESMLAAELPRLLSILRRRRGRPGPGTSGDGVAGDGGRGGGG